MTGARLIEAAFPLKQVSLDSVHEKNVRHGHISTLHIWPARQPLAASRAALLATLLPEPDGREARRRLLERMAGQPAETRGGIFRWGREGGPEVARFREEVREAFGGRAPRVLDPFAGGGAIPLEAMRLGCEAVAADINPVAAGGALPAPAAETAGTGRRRAGVRGCAQREVRFALSRRRGEPAVVDRQDGKEYRLPTEVEVAAARVSDGEPDHLYAGIPFGLLDEPPPKAGIGAARAFSVDGYGLDAWRKLFTNRQLLALGTFVREIRGCASFDSASLRSGRTGIERPRNLVVGFHGQSPLSRLPA